MTTTAVAEPEAQDRAREYGWPTLVVVLSGTFMATLDFFIVNVDRKSVV